MMSSVVSNVSQSFLLHAKAFQTITAYSLYIPRSVDEYVLVDQTELWLGQVVGAELVKAGVGADGGEVGAAADGGQTVLKGLKYL